MTRIPKTWHVELTMHLDLSLAKGAISLSIDWAESSSIRTEKSFKQPNMTPSPTSPTMSSTILLPRHGRASRTITPAVPGLLVDFHGHTHPEARIELGYKISASQLRESDATLDGLAYTSSIKNMPSEYRFDRLLAIFDVSDQNLTRLVVDVFHFQLLYPNIQLIFCRPS